MRRKIVLLCLIGGGILFIVLCVRFYGSFEIGVKKPVYIAHAGGSIEGYSYTNSLEAVTNALNNGINYVEIDLNYTIDSVLVCVHDWNHFNRITNCDKDSIPSFEEFKRRKIYGKFTPISFYDIDSIMSVTPQMFLVTDKISEPSIIDKYFSKYKNRLVIECFSIDDYAFYMKQGYYLPMLSLNLNPRSIFVQNLKYSLFLSDLKYNCVDIWINQYKNEKQIFPIKKAVYSCEDKIKADSLFLYDKNLRLIYIDNVD